MIEESKYSSDVMKKHFHKEIVRIKKDNEYFENSTNCWICENVHIDNEVKVKHHCHITRNYRDSSQRYCNINVKLKQISSRIS